MRKQLCPLLLSLFLCLPSIVNACEDYIILRIENVDNDDGTISAFVYADGFKDIVGFQFSVAYDFKNYAFDQFVSTHFSSLNYNENPFGMINLSFLDFTAVGITLSKDQALGEFRYKKIGSQNFDLKLLTQNEGGLKVEFVNTKSQLLCPFSDDFVQPNLGLTINGRVLLDMDSDCIADPNNAAASEWYINVSSPTNVYRQKINDDGSFVIFVKEFGTVTLTSLPPSDLWKSCSDSQEFTFDATNVNGSSQKCSFLAQPTELKCPKGKIDVANPLLRRCFDNIFYVAYANLGTGPLIDAKIEIQLDDKFILKSCSLPNFTLTNDNRLIADVATLDVMKKGQFYFEINIDCDKSLLGETHCIEAKLLPFNDCGVNYIGPKLDLKSECKNNTIKFTITNVGQQAMTESLNYIVIEDDVMKTTKPVKLQVAESLEYSIEATTSTYRIILPQVKDYKNQTFLTKAIEACTTDPNPSLGYITNFQESDEELYIDILCKENTGSFNSNEMMVLPRGYGDAQNILPNTELEYMIRFQNTGTDTAINVWIKDTIMENLDLSSFNLKYSSHPVNISMKDNVILFAYPSIMLLDSTKSVSNSRGFIAYSVKTKKDLDNAKVSNRASIYFDYNKPIATNTINQNIALWVLAKAVDKPLDQLMVNIYPNPTSRWINFVNKSGQEVRIKIFNANGTLVDELNFAEAEFSYDALHLKGFYFCQNILSNGQKEVFKLMID